MALIDNAIAYYKFDESSGDASDSVASNTLTNVNTVTYSAGKINNGANFAQASSQYFTGGSITMPAAFTVSGWFKLNSVSGNLDTIFNHNSTGANAIWVGAVNNALYLSNFTTDINTGAVLSASTWYFFVAKSDGTTASISINAGTPVTGAVSHSSTATTFWVGERQDSNASTYLDGSIDELYIVGRQITGTEETTLYNSGAGLQYPFVIASDSNCLAMGYAF